MIVYQSTKKGFYKDVLEGDIDGIIERKVLSELHRKTGESELASWRNSLHYMNTVLQDPELPEDLGICIETQIPQTSKRIDFIITGQDENRADHAIIIELKQWTTATLTGMDGLVNTRFKHGYSDTNHPSYQAWSYAALIEGFNEAVYTEEIKLRPCAYLHNYEADDVITNEFYKEYLDKAPVFLKRDAIKLQAFIKKFVRYGDTKQIIYRIDKGKIKPSKMLADSLSALMKGNQEFILIDDQKVVYETALALVKKSTPTDKYVLIVQGGPGTGKSVVAVNLLVEITKQQKLVQYVTKNAAPRAVYESKLTGTLNKSKFSLLFQGSGAYIKCPPNTFDALVVDEAHRLNAKSGMFKHLGENQVKEIIQAARCSIFFIDENQKVTLSDIGTKDEIIRWAKAEGAKVHELKLESQFRCNGSDGYLAWLDNTLQIRKTANTDIRDLDYDFRVLSSPNELRDLIRGKNRESNNARMVAGYCWKWPSKKSPGLPDVIIPEHDFRMTWNLATDGSLWIMKPESVNEIGCIHTCQGLEVDYIGVVVGLDLIVRNGRVITDASKRASSDKSVHGYKKLLKDNPTEGKATIETIIKNTYRTLMTRGMKGCYVYFVDKETEEYFTNSL
jgi:DUF2075 family protein